ncbi:MAG: D-2-hydroxyacid dehydrogenase [Gammaproteobacteria bacterium]
MNHWALLRLALAVALLVGANAAVAAADIVAELDLRAADEPVSAAERWAPRGPIVVRVDSAEQLAGLQQVAGATPLVGVADEAAALERIGDATAIIGFCSPSLVAAAPKLHWIQIYWAGAETCIAATAGADNELLITNMQRATGPQIAEHVFGMLLGLSRGIAAHVRVQDEAIWDPQRFPITKRVELGGKTLLLVGLGGIGTAVAERAHAFGMRIVAVRASGRPGPDYVAEVARPDQLLRLAAEADAIVNSAPLTPKTKGMFDAEFFATMKPSAYFVNVGRGGSVVTDDLVAALRAGELAGVGLDVTDPEPLPRDHPLWQMQNVIITPHVAADSDRVYERLFLVVRENLRRYVSGEPMLSVVDTERGY